MPWGSNASPIDGITYGHQYHDWIYTLFSNSCTAVLNVKIETAWEKLEEYQQANVVYLWLMIDVIINITNDAAVGLKSRIKAFGQKGLAGMYPRGKNVERMMLYMLSIADALDQLGVLPALRIFSLKSDVERAF